MTSSSLLTRIGLGGATLATGVLVTLTTALPGATAGTRSPNDIRLGCAVTADAAEHWIADGSSSSCVDRSGGPAGHRYVRHCAGSADAAEHWLRATGRLPGCPGDRVSLGE
jgi:hypothetical protein